MSAIIILWQREVIRYARDWVRILSSLFQPITFLVIFGFGFETTLFQGGNYGFNFLQFMYPGIIAINIMGIAVFSTFSTVWDREFGFLKEILVAPVSRTTIAIGKTTGAATIASAQALILLIIAPLLGIHLSAYAIVVLILLMLFLSFSLAGLGLLIASLLDSTERFGIIMQFIIFPLFFLSGAFFSLNSVPKWMAILSKVDPLTYGVDAFRQIMLRGQISSSSLSKVSLFPVSVDAIILIGISVLLTLLSVIAFNKRN